MVVSGLSGRAHQHFTDEGLLALLHEEGDNVGNVAGLEAGIGVGGYFAAEFGVDRAGCNDGDANAMVAELFCYGVGEAIEAPFRGRVGGSVFERIVAGEG